MRSLFGVAYMLPFFAKQKTLPFLKVNRPLLQLIRVIAGSASTACTYYAYQHLPLSIATSLGLTAPLFVSLISIPLLKEGFSLERLAIILFGYFGVLLIVQPSWSGADPAMLIAIFANCFASFAMIFTKLLSGTEKNEHLLLYSNSGMLLFSGLIAVFTFSNLNPSDLFILALIAISGLLSQYCNINALRRSTPSKIAPFEYSRLILMLPLDFFLFAKLPNPLAGVGIICIIFSNYAIAIKSRKKEALAST